MYRVQCVLTPTLGGPAEELVRARVVNAHDDLLPYRPVVLHLGVFPFVSDAVRVRVVFDHGGRGLGVDRGRQTVGRRSVDRGRAKRRTSGGISPAERKRGKLAAVEKSRTRKNGRSTTLMVFRRLRAYATLACVGECE